MANSNAIRPAQQSDIPAIREFTTDTFSWGDYVGESIEDWLADERGVIPVLVEDNTPVAMVRAVLLSESETWIQAARVHPNHRRRGLGSALNDWAVAWAGSQGAHVVRLMTEKDNIAPQRQVERLGYRLIGEWVGARRTVSRTELDPQTNGGVRVPGDERLDIAPRAEAQPAWSMWSTSVLIRGAHRLAPVEGWMLRSLTLDDVNDGMGLGLWQCASGWIIGGVEDEDTFVVRWLVTTEDDADRIMRAIVDLAAEHAEHLLIFAPALPWITEALTRSGLELHPQLIWQKQVS
ncbi:MAG: GNAT family N-acetyltransferase [Acidimicrobiia bacterium]|nr:GNAT family N-acetyltransferase [Acidimicrobiia bacterium]